MCPGSVNRGAAVFQSVWGKKKMKQRRLLFAPYLVPPTPSLWRFLLKGFLTEEREGGEGLEEVSEKWGKTSAGEDGKRLFCMVFNAFFFPGGLWDSCEGSVPPMTVCLPVRMGTVSACDWMPVPALPSGWSLHCGTASE